MNAASHFADRPVLGVEHQPGDRHHPQQARPHGETSPRAASCRRITGCGRWRKDRPSSAVHIGSSGSGKSCRCGERPTAASLVPRSPGARRRRPPMARVFPRAESAAAPARAVWEGRIGTGTATPPRAPPQSLQGIVPPQPRLPILIASPINAIPVTVSSAWRARGDDSVRASPPPAAAQVRCQLAASAT